MVIREYLLIRSLIPTKHYKFLLIFLTIHSFVLVGSPQKLPRKNQTKRGFRYIQETNVPHDYKQKILILSYGSLVKQKMNRKTGDVLYAGPFTKTSIAIPISFTFLAGYPKTGYHTAPDILETYKNRRATAAIDANSDEYKNLWVATSDFSLLSNARNNLAAREGAPFINKKQGYDLSSIFYIRKVSNASKKKTHEESIVGFPGWVMLRPPLSHQQLTPVVLYDIVKLLQEHHGDAAIWVALPANVNKNVLFDLLKDPVFVTNTARYIHNMPPGNSMTKFEEDVLNMAQ